MQARINIIEGVGIRTVLAEPGTALSDLVQPPIQIVSGGNSVLEGFHAGPVSLSCLPYSKIRAFTQQILTSSPSDIIIGRL